MPDTTPSRPAMTMREIRDRLGHTQPDTTPTDRRTLTADEYSSAWHAVEGSTGEPGADPATVLAAVLRVLDINPPARLVLGTTDQQPEITPADTGLRDRIRRAICEADGFGWDTDMLEPDEYGEQADAVLAVLPAPVDRAAVLREAADFLRDAHFTDGMSVQEIGTALGHMADVAQQPETDAAYPTTTTWTVEAREPNGTWTEWGDHYTSDKAHQLAAEFRRTAPNRGIRVVRQVVTYTVEFAADQPDTETEAAK
ncbi:hypothetical protein OG209_05395 [Streptomyces sp. NBC_01383]|uniref:hypothetical protein n=1 Tax=Streptomyces sp. NBC_01383 TaxID=2903846 RepID=UPI00324B0923